MGCPIAEINGNRILFERQHDQRHNGNFQHRHLKHDSNIKQRHKKETFKSENTSLTIEVAYMWLPHIANPFIEINVSCSLSQ